MGCINGELDETEFNTFVLKEPYYNTIMISTFQGLTVPEGQKEEISMMNGWVVKFKYSEAVANN